MIVGTGLLVATVPGSFPKDLGLRGGTRIRLIHKTLMIGSFWNMSPFQNQQSQKPILEPDLGGLFACDEWGTAVSNTVL